MRPMARHPTRTREKVRAGSPGASRGCCTRDSQPSRLVLSFTLWARETRVSKHLHYDWWVRLSSWRGSRAACCVSCFVSSPNPAADGAQTTKRTDGCLAWKARRCRWRARAAAQARRNAHQHAASTLPPATCPACPAARRTSVCADTAPTHCSRRPSSCSRRGHNQRRSHYPQSHQHHRSQLEQRQVQRWRQRFQRWRPRVQHWPPQVHRWPRRVRRWRPLARRWASARPPAPSRSRARPTASWSSAPRSCDNQAINYHAILFIRYVTRELKGRYHSCGLV